MNKKEKIIRILLTSLIVLSYIGLEAVLHLNVENLNLFRSLIKAGIGIFSLLLSVLSLIRHKNPYSVILFLVIALFMAADISINYSFLAGGGIFALGHLILLIYFLRHDKLTKYSFLAAGISFACFLVVILIFDRSNIPLMIMLLLYALLISFLFGSSIKEKLSIRIGILVFVISDALLMVNIGLGANIILGHFARGVYYLSIILLGNTYREEIKG